MGGSTVKRVRDYRAVVERLRRISHDHKLSLEQIGEASGHELFCLESTLSRTYGRTFFLSAGTHGDEPAAVEGLLRWLERGSWREDGYNIFVLPLINPWGYEHNKRENEQGLDINRQFRFSRCVESEAVKRVLRGRHFNLAIELHEDIDSSGFYLYEIKSRPPYLGEPIMRAIQRIGPMNRKAEIEGMLSRGGIIRRPNATSQLLRRKHWPLSFFMSSYHTAHKLTLETPGPRDFEMRVAMHLAAVETAFRCKLDPPRHRKSIDTSEAER